MSWWDAEGGAVWAARREYLLGRVEVNGWSLRALARLFGVSRERIRQELAAAYQARDGQVPADIRRPG